jgi:hypothetical protein
VFRRWSAWRRNKYREEDGCCRRVKLRDPLVTKGGTLWLIAKVAKGISRHAFATIEQHQ